MPSSETLDACIDEMIAVYMRNAKEEASQRVVNDLRQCKAKGRPFGKLMLSHLGMGGGMFEGVAEMLQVWGRLGADAEFVLSYNDPGAAGVDRLFKKTMLRGVSVIELFACNLYDEACKTIGQVLKTNPPLTRLKLGDNNLTWLGARHIASGLGPHNTSLVQLHLGGNPLGDKGAAQLSLLAVHNNRSLTSLGLRETGLTPAGLALLGDAITDPSNPLRELNIKGNKLVVSAPRHFANAMLVSNPGLRQLEAQNTDMTAAALSVLLPGIVFTGLKDLNVGFNPLGNYGVIQLAKALRVGLSPLETLGLEKVGVAGEGVKAISDFIKASTTMRGLVLKDNLVGEDGAKHLSETLSSRSATLTSLNLNQCMIPEPGCLAFAAAVSVNRSLTAIDFGSNFTSEQGGAQWGTSLKRNSTLTRLTLTDNEIPAHTIRYLASCMAENYTLRGFNFGGQSTVRPYANRVTTVTRQAITNVLQRNKADAHRSEHVVVISVDSLPTPASEVVVHIPPPVSALDNPMDMMNVITRSLVQTLGDWVQYTKSNAVAEKHLKEQEKKAEEASPGKKKLYKAKRGPLIQIQANTV